MADIEDAASRVRAALAAKLPPARKDVERALRDSLGLTARQAKRFASQGAKAIGSADDSMDEVLQRVRQLEARLR